MNGLRKKLSELFSKIGMKPKIAFSCFDQPAATSVNTNAPQRPNTMDGIAAIRSTISVAILATRLGAMNSMK